MTYCEIKICDIKRKKEKIMLEMETKKGRNVDEGRGGKDILYKEGEK